MEQEGGEEEIGGRKIEARTKREEKVGRRRKAEHNIRRNTVDTS